MSSPGIQPGPKGTKPTNLPSSPHILPPRNSFRGLPLELREQIYDRVFEDLTAEPRHPYSDLPLNSRFHDYIALLLADKATSDEAKRVFTREYAERIVFYFEDACSLFDLHRRSETEPFPDHVRFVLRTRTDLDPEEELGDRIEWMNQGFFLDSLYTADGAKRWDMSLTGLHFSQDKVVNRNGNPLGPDFHVRDSDHSDCDQKQQCIPYKSVRFPPFLNSLRVETAVWKMQVSSKWDAHRQQTTANAKDVSVSLFSGKLRDVSFSHFPVKRAKIHLIEFLIRCSWPKFLAKYEGRYPTDRKEYCKLYHGEIKYKWPRSDIEHMPPLDGLSIGC